MTRGWYCKVVVPRPNLGGGFEDAVKTLVSQTALLLLSATKGGRQITVRHAELRANIPRAVARRSEAIGQPLQG